MTPIDTCHTCVGCHNLNPRRGSCVSGNGFPFQGSGTPTDKCNKINPSRGSSLIMESQHQTTINFNGRSPESGGGIVNSLAFPPWRHSLDSGKRYNFSLMSHTEFRQRFLHSSPDSGIGMRDSFWKLEAFGTKLSRYLLFRPSLLSPDMKVMMSNYRQRDPK